MKNNQILEVVVLKCKVVGLLKKKKQKAFDFHQRYWCILVALNLIIVINSEIIWLKNSPLLHNSHASPI